MNKDVEDKLHHKILSFLYDSMNESKLNEREKDDFIFNHCRAGLSMIFRSKNINFHDIYLLLEQKWSNKK